jgi:hypothetical protein
LESIRREIQADPIGISQTAIEFLEPKHVIEYESPRYQALRQIGILRWVNEWQMQLFEGAIQRLVQGLAKAPQSNRLGTVAAESGLRRFEGDDFRLTADDIVVLHLSDLHVGEDYGFLLEFEGHRHNEGAASLSDLLASDLRKLDLLGKIDAIVWSGDLVSTGKSSEFLRAAELLNDISAKCHVPIERMIVIPGNHDLEWNPDTWSGTAPGTSRAVSRDSFGIFSQLVKKEKFDSCSRLLLSSRSEKRNLLLLGLDSNFVEGPGSAGVGYISKQTLERTGQVLSSCASDSGTTPPLWLIVHHHVFPVSSANLEHARERNISVMGNASELLWRAHQWLVELILHGHEHQPSMTWAQRWVGETRSAAFRPIGVLGAGSCGAKREKLGALSKNHYYALIRRQREIIIRSRILGDQGLDFISHADLSISVTE